MNNGILTAIRSDLVIELRIQLNSNIDPKMDSHISLL